MLLAFSLVSIVLLLAQATAASPHEQEIFVSTHTSAPREKVSGHNHVYYTQVDKADQLFFIIDLAVHPDPPRLNEHNFVLLNGWLDETYPGLEDATLKLSGECPRYGEIEGRIADIQRPVVRHLTSNARGYEYGGPLMKEFNELLYDQLWPYFPGKERIKVNCWFEATARLPDKRVLFSFAANFTVQWPPID
ncbi:hypothetical protein BDV95DRAFT_599021 [Massariosphaeria phaeospora]|uniref:Phosphatidylglycerol/phosphatidylinositol transfer protein n=1 Tax=Massariosphaeria phaeospora TaxID=100035 RepID=A0A7C8M5L7_9PLEO|nr:hypothetical protein BDV95DRAFT_599021 [Massariosphaeria phaeospora]